MDSFEVIAVLLERVLNGTHLDADMPHDPVVTVMPGRVVIDGRFRVISADKLRPIHVEIGIESLRDAATTVARRSDEPFPRSVAAWGILCTEIQESLVFEANGTDPASPVTLTLP